MVAMRNQILPYDVFVETLREDEADALKAYPVLVVCGDTACSERMARAVRRRGLEAICCSSVGDARALLSRNRYSLVFSSMILPDGDLRSVIASAGRIPVVVFSRRADWEAYAHVLEEGALDYIACPESAEAGEVLELALSGSASKTSSKSQRGCHARKAGTRFVDREI